MAQASKCDNCGKFYEPGEVKPIEFQYSEKKWYCIVHIMKSCSEDEANQMMMGGWGPLMAGIMRYSKLPSGVEYGMPVDLCPGCRSLLMVEALRGEFMKVEKLRKLIDGEAK